MIIASWGPVPGHCSVTINTCLISAYMAFNKQRSVLCMDNHNSSGKLKNIMLPGSDDAWFNIFTYANTNNLSSDKIKVFTNGIINNRLHIIGASKQRIVMDNMNDDIYRTVLGCAEQAFEYVLVDTNAGNTSESTDSILKYCDFVIINLPQDDYIIKKYVTKCKGYWNPYLEGKKYIHIIGNYKNNYAHQSIRKITSQYCLKNAFYIPENMLLHKAITEQRFVKWFVFNMGKQIQNNDQQLINNLENICEHILEIPKKKGLFSELREKISSYAIGANNSKYSIRAIN